MQDVGQRNLPARQAEGRLLDRLGSPHIPKPEASHGDD
jgi:hypothetical protein